MWLLVGILLIMKAGWTDASTDRRVLVVWEEEIPPLLPPSTIETTPDSEDDTYHNNRSGTRRRWISFGPLHTAADREEPTKPVESHPLRTDEWKLSVRWKAKRRKSLGRCTLFLDFSPDGYVRCRDEASTHSWIGSWELTPTGLSWKVALDEQGSPYAFHADLHINPFGSHPRFSRGLVLSESRKWFRPVVATFTGVGIGEDSVDLSYGRRITKNHT